MLIDRELNYTKDWTNAQDFPDYYTSEGEVRSAIQLLFDEARDYLNSAAADIYSAFLPVLKYDGTSVTTTPNPELTFTKSWESSEDFPSYESDETQVREDRQLLFDELADFINDDFRPWVVDEMNKRLPVDEQVDDEDFPAFAYTKAWTEPDDFPTDEVNEIKVRQDMQFLWNEIRAWANTQLVSGSWVNTVFDTIRVRVTGIAWVGVSLDASYLRYSDTTDDSYNAGLLPFFIWPANATDRSFTAVSSNPSVASVEGYSNPNDPYGSYCRVTAHSTGTTTITVTTTDGGFSVSKTITVVRGIDSVTILNADPIAVYVDESVQLQYSVSPSDFDTNRVSLEFDSASGRFEVSESGVITGRQPGLDTLWVEEDSRTLGMLNGGLRLLYQTRVIIIGEV